MTFYIKAFIASLIIFAILDFIWLGKIAIGFNTEQLQEIGRMENGELSVLKLPAVLVYLVMAMALTVFAAPHIQSDSLVISLIYGALLGFAAYGIFDLTNLAILKNYPLKFALVDMAWGTFQFAAANGILFSIRRWLI